MHVKRFKCEFVSSIQQISIKCHENKEGGGHSRPPIFGPCLFGQTAGWIKMPLGMEIGLGTLGKGDIVLDGDPAPLP